MSSVQRCVEGLHTWGKRPTHGTNWCFKINVGDDDD